MILALIEQDLRAAIANRGSRRRRRPDKTNFYLAVYDQAVVGQSFRGIATTLRKPLSSVRTAYLVALAHIYGSATLAPSKSQLAWQKVDPETHIEACQECRQAGTTEQMCQLVRAYVNQDTRAPIRRGCATVAE